MHDPEGQQGAEFGAWIQAALALRFAADPVVCLAAIATRREEVPGALPGASVTVTAALARLQMRTIDNQYAIHNALPDRPLCEEGAESVRGDTCNNS